MDCVSRGVLNRENKVLLSMQARCQFGEPGASATGVGLSPVADAPGSPCVPFLLFFQYSSTAFQLLCFSKWDSCSREEESARWPGNRKSLSSPGHRRELVERPCKPSRVMGHTLAYWLAARMGWKEHAGTPNGW